MVDVQQRARRRQRRRAASMVCACAVVVLGGAGVLALRHDRTPLAITAGDGSAPPATTIACLEVVPTTAPALDPTGLPAFDPNLTTTTYPPNVAPSLVPGESTTDPFAGATLPPFVGNPCSAPTGQWRCQGPLSTTSDGWAYFQYCESVFENATTVVPTTYFNTVPPTTYDPKFPPQSTILTTYPPGDIVIATTASNP
jgi:hypothetical protein